VRGVVKNIGFDPFIYELRSVDSKGLNYQDCEVLVRINKQSPDIAGGVHVGKDDCDDDVGGQDICSGTRVMRLRTPRLSHTRWRLVGGRN